MEIKLHAGIHIDKTFEEYLTAKIEKLGRFMFDEGKVELYLKREGPEYISEMTVHTKHFTFFLKEQADNLTGSVETLLDKMKVKLQKTHDKIIEKSHKGSTG